jgi:hypothetical protein
MYEFDIIKQHGEKSQRRNNKLFHMITEWVILLDFKITVTQKLHSNKLNSAHYFARNIRRDMLGVLLSLY